MRYVYDSDLMTISFSASVPGVTVTDTLTEYTVTFPAGTFPPFVNVVYSTNLHDLSGQVMAEFTGILPNAVEADGSLIASGPKLTEQYVTTLSPLFPSTTLSYTP